MVSRGRLSLLHCIVMVFLCTRICTAENDQKQDVPVVDAEAGPCSVEMMVTDNARKPVNAALIRVRISYGALRGRKTVLEIRTNAQGRANFIGLPEDGEIVLYFHATKGALKGDAVHSTAQNCKAVHLIALRPR